MNNLYHGTIKNNAENILKTQIIIPSVGDRHWLGDGIYFYKEDLMAYNWCFYEYKRTNNINKIEEVNPDDFYNNQSILLAKVDINDKRTFDLSLVKCQISFIKCRNYLKEKNLFPKNNNHSCPEGVILNLMFNNLGFNKNFDIVIADFYKKDYYAPFGKTRMPIITEKQICIKKNICIKSIENFDYRHKISGYNELLSFIHNNKKYEYSKKMKYKYKSN